MTNMPLAPTTSNQNTPLANAVFFKRKFLRVRSTNLFILTPAWFGYYSNTNGQVRLTKIDYPLFSKKTAVVKSMFKSKPSPYQLGTHGQAIVDIDVLETAEKRIMYVQETENGTNEVNLLFFKAAGGLFDDGEFLQKGTWL